MSLRETILSVAKTFPDYFEKKVNDSNHPVHKLVTKEFPSLLKGIIGEKTPYITKGSTGNTNVTYAPWIAAYDPLITTSATDGYYFVYLYSVDLKRLYISLGVGVTEFQNHFGNNNKMRGKILEAAEAYAGVIRLHAKSLYPEEGVLKFGKTDLKATTKTKLHRNYEYGNIVAIEYDLSDLPSNESLERDVLNFIDLYSELASHPLAPDNEQLLEVSVEEPSDYEVSEEGFKSRPRVNRSPKSGVNKNYRRSRESIKTGTRGEEIVFEHEKNKLKKLGKIDLAEKVDWIAARRENDGYDILSFTPDGEEKYIEVKSSVGKKISSLDITKNEWSTASAKTHKNNYYIYLVTDVFKNPKIEILQNPFKAVEERKIGITTSVFRIDLHEQDK